MQRTFDKIKPLDIVEAFDAGENLWDRFGAKTAVVMADGVRTLRAIWKGAWNQAKGDTRIAERRLREVDHQQLIKLYMRKTWVPSKTLRTIGSALR